MSVVAAKRPLAVSMCGGLLGNARATSQREIVRSARNFSGGEVNSQKDDREKVVVLGSGWAGYTFARRLNPKKYNAVIVSPRSYFVFTPLLASTSVGTLEFRTALEPIRNKRTHADFIQGWADSVDFFNKRISIEEAVDDPRLGLAPTGRRHVELSTGEHVTRRKGKTFNLDYDKLIITVGCYSQTFSIPGVREHALFLKDVGDARRIRKRILACFENAALPTTSDAMKKHFLNFAVVGGGPTGIEFAAELHDFITEDLAKVYKNEVGFAKITVYDVAPTVLPMFDEELGKYAMKQFAREGIEIKTSHHIKSLRKGLPDSENSQFDPKDEQYCMTLDVQEEGQIGAGMVVWSTGLMENPFVKNGLGSSQLIKTTDARLQNISEDQAVDSDWIARRDKKTGSLITDSHLRLVMEPKEQGDKGITATLTDVFALGDCAIIKDTAYPATAQVASQKADWLAKELNKGINGQGFRFNNLGVMAYLGNWNAIVQLETGKVSGRTAWFLWRGAYLTKSVSWRNKILIPMYWFINWAFGRDVSRF
ncbi:NADH dehydrogenase [Microthyrium microscopicum]|uniref:NADH dehydrogenase n=1 Tax=Microthyrium microscopicum TaxID=703497 RepID=A0A6A6US80_9PEZI|nr:NADH dehydrogenase [Microthyrium microscopicum]